MLVPKRIHVLPLLILATGLALAAGYMADEINPVLAQHECTAAVGTITDPHCDGADCRLFGADCADYYEYYSYEEGVCSQGENQEIGCRYLSVAMDERKHAVCRCIYYNWPDGKCNYERIRIEGTVMIKTCENVTVP